MRNALAHTPQTHCRRAAHPSFRFACIAVVGWFMTRIRPFVTRAVFATSGGRHRTSFLGDQETPR